MDMNNMPDSMLPGEVLGFIIAIKCENQDSINIKTMDTGDARPEMLIVADTAWGLLTDMARLLFGSNCSDNLAMFCQSVIADVETDNIPDNIQDQINDAINRTNK